MWRIAFFLGLAGSALTPLAHLAYLYGFGNTYTFFGASLSPSLSRSLRVSPATPANPPTAPVTLSALAYLIGLSFYAGQFPEAVAPGQWDNLFASHQWWHVAIVVAVWMHWRALTFWAEMAALGQDLSCVA